MSALIVLLVRLRQLLEQVPDHAYTARPAPSLSGSIGEHVRHCLDHVAVLANAPDARCISYDDRTRATADETMRGAAMARIEALVAALAAIGDEALDCTITVNALLHQNGDRLRGASSVAREVLFVTHHTIHHFAVIALLLDRLGVEVPARFAHAPATLKAA